MKIFFTSDTHFGHQNVIKYCNRPFSSVKEMNTEMIEAWNLQVKPDDRVIHLGDFAFCGSLLLSNILSSLNGSIDIVPGNHDTTLLKTLKNYPELQEKVYLLPPLYEETLSIKDRRIPFVFCHYAMKVWNKSHFGAIHLYGHSHGSLAEDPNSLSMDVGVDTAWSKSSGMLYSLEEVIEIMDKKKFNPLDHHTGDR